ncbi:MAG: DNA translocase FtsK [Gammaproteobacteria bacterium]
MAQAIRKKAVPSTPSISVPVLRHLKEGTLIACAAVAVFMFTALLSYQPADPAWTHTSTNAELVNKGGMAGALFADVTLYLFGRLALVLPLGLVFTIGLLSRSLQRVSGIDYVHGVTRAVGFAVMLTAGCGLLAMYFADATGLPHYGSGILGKLIGTAVASMFGHLGGSVLLLALLLAGVTLFTGLSWFWVMDLIGAQVLELAANARRHALLVADRWQGRRAIQAREAVLETETSKAEQRPKPRIEPAPLVTITRPVLTTDRQTSLFETGETLLPPLHLLDEPPPAKGGYSTETLQAMSRQVELKLLDFGIEVAVVAVHPGPVITRFELQPAPGVKAARITSLARDLARSLSTISVRVVEVIPGKSVIGLEIPNQEREVVSLREVMSSQEYERSQSPLTLGLGKDIGGKPVVVDLARMPHLLVAGTTGAGKSVALNAKILSLLYKATPEQVRLIMIDPKMLELSVYEGITSLLAPVVTDMKEAANALRWCVAEMERRYRLMATLGVRNLAGYNRMVSEAAERGEPLRDPGAGLGNPEPPVLSTLPHIVVIVDELADMMMTVGKKVEELIARLAQKARASGIHLILATQRPSVDVITGLIKANIPSRIAFQVSSRVDSRTILDQMGAENLLGHGDMLYLPPGTGLPMRVHGAFVSDQEVHRAVAFIKGHGAPDYVDAILHEEEEATEERSSAGTGTLAGGEDDALYDEAVRFITETRRASVSGVQRRLKIGYNRAARLVEDMERAGVVGALQSNGFREVLAPPPPKD